MPISTQTLSGGAARHICEADRKPTIDMESGHAGMPPAVRQTMLCSNSGSMGTGKDEREHAFSEFSKQAASYILLAA